MGLAVNGSQDLLSSDVRDMIAAAGHAGELVDPAVFRELTELVLADARHGLGLDLNEDWAPSGPSRGSRDTPSRFGSSGGALQLSADLFATGGGAAAPGGLSRSVHRRSRSSASWSGARHTEPVASWSVRHTLSDATARVMARVGLLPPSSPVGASRGVRLLEAAGLKPEELACAVVLEESGSLDQTAAFALLHIADATRRVVEPAVRHDLAHSGDILQDVLRAVEGPHADAMAALQDGAGFTLTHLEAWLVALRRLADAGRLPLAHASHGRGARWWRWVGQTNLQLPATLRQLRNDAARQGTVSEDRYRQMCHRLFGTALVSEWLTLHRAPVAQPHWLDAYMDRLERE